MISVNLALNEKTCGMLGRNEFSMIKRGAFLVNTARGEILDEVAFQMCIRDRYKTNDKFYMIRHMPLEGFIHTMAHCSCMISNSSSGIREAASYGVPVINIGHRQIDRERNKNVIDIGDRYEELRSTIEKYMGHRFERENIYFKSNCADQIASRITQFIEMCIRDRLT